MFIEKCFIRKNTQEIRNKLSKIGYLESAFYCGDLSNLCVNVLGNGEYDEANDYAPLLCNAIDCGDNEDLFLAIAARRDDTDYMQFFVTEAKQAWVNIGTYISKGSFELCLVNDRYMGKNKEFCNTVVPAHKATVEELIEHFK